MIRLFYVRSDKDTHFTGALAQNVGEAENISLINTGIGSIYGDDRGYCILKTLQVIADQNLDWEVSLWAKDTFDAPTDLDAFHFIGRWAFVVADGLQAQAAGPYLYYIDGLNVPYLDLDETSELHVLLVNRNLTGKNAGATGEVVVQFGLEKGTE